MRKKRLRQVAVTTWMERFSQAIAVLCNGRVPPAALVEKWVENVEDNQLTLQDWVFGEGAASLPWAQALVILDAAQILADNPEEGCGHIDA